MANMASCALIIFCGNNEELVGLVFGASRRGGFIQNCTIDIYILSVHVYCITFADFSYETPAGG